MGQYGPLTNVAFGGGAILAGYGYITIQTYSISTALVQDNLLSGAIEIRIYS
jgi:hypothetical protein